MQIVDRLLQRWRIAQAVRYVRKGDRLLDVGCFDRALLDRLAGRIAGGVGVDPLARPYRHGRVEVLRDTFPGRRRFADGRFDCVCMLAVLEHVKDTGALSRECFRVLADGGRLIVTVPHPLVDQILKLLLAVGAIDGMSDGVFDEHAGFDVRRTPGIFRAAGFRLLVQRRFQLGLNCVFVFTKPAAPAGRADSREETDPRAV